MNVTELARILKINTQELRDKLPQLGFDIGQRAIKVDNRIAQKIIKEWPRLIKEYEMKQEKENQLARLHILPRKEATRTTMGKRMDAKYFKQYNNYRTSSLN